jgi:acyl carrier protein
MNQPPVSLTRSDLLNADSAGRVALVERYALDVLAALRPPAAKLLNGSSRLADTGMDSLQVVELKFSLDELLGQESDVEMFISNPSFRELAESIVRGAGL